MIKLRSSKLGQARRCPPSVLTDGPKIEGDRTAANLGSAGHISLLYPIGYGQPLEVSQAAAMYGCEGHIEELKRLVAQSWECWKQVEHHFPDPVVEVELERDFGFVHLGGRIDLLSIVGTQARDLDLKTGWSEQADYTDQLKAYAWLILHEYPQVEEVYSAILRPRQGDIESAVYTRDELAYWWAGVLNDLQDATTYRAGAHCLHCPRAATCEAHTNQIRQAISTMPRGEMLPESPQGWAWLLDEIRLIESICEKTRLAIKAKLAAAGGNCPTGDGRELVLATEERETIRYTPSSQRILMEAGFTSDDWEAIAKLSKTEIRKIDMDRQPRGQKAVHFEGIMNQLRACGAVETTFIETLKLKRCEP